MLVSADGSSSAQQVLTQQNQNTNQQSSNSGSTTNTATSSTAASPTAASTTTTSGQTTSADFTALDASYKRFAISQMLTDQQAEPGGPSTPTTGTGSSTATELTPAQQQQINDGVKKVEDRLAYGYSDAAAELANQLRGQTTAYQGQFISAVNNQMGPMLTTRVLRAGAGEPPRFA